MATPAELLSQSLTALRNAKRFSHTSNSYAKDNPSEYAKVIAYLDGGGFPEDVSTQMGIHAVLQEEARRMLLVPDPPDPPDPGNPLPPINITQGGTYTGFWKTANSTPAVTISTTQPVIIENSIIESTATGPTDHLLRASGAANVTIRRCTFNGPSAFPNGGWGRAIWFSGGFTSAVIENNTINRTGGIYLQQCVSGATIRVRFNKGRNGQSDISGGTVRQFCQLNNNHNASQILIEWNEVINEPGKSRSEDVFSIFNTSYAVLRNNYVQGGWAYPLSFTPSRGSGMLVSDVPQGHHNQAYDNQIIGITNVAMGITGGHDNSIYNNTVVSDGKAPDGTILTNANNGVVCYDYYNNPSVFYNNKVYGNKIGNMGYRNGALVRVDEWCPGAANNVPADNTFYYGNHSTPITKADEDAEWPKWLAKIAAAGVTIGA
jgi:hypothetical protein